jgi:hypothetical protein
MDFPQSLQTCSSFGGFLANALLLFASRLFRVSRVAINARLILDIEAGFVTDDKINRVTSSVTGPTSLRHVSDVSQSLIANGEPIRQLPLRSSQKSERHSDSV